MQAPLNSCLISYGARIFSHAGKILAVALSKVKEFTRSVTFRWETVDDDILLQRARQLVFDTNATGFLSAWFCTGPDPERYYLIDYNARVERHACLLGVLREEDFPKDPCYVFQQIASGQRRVEDFHEMMRVPGGYEYMDPIRLAWTERVQWTDDELDQSKWNIWRSDSKIMAMVETAVPQLAAAKARRAGHAKEEL